MRPKIGSGLVVAILSTVAVSVVAAEVEVPLNVEAVGRINTTGSEFDTLVLRADLTGIVGLDRVGSITIVDDGTTTGGGAGVLSGFDLDAIFLDRDGDLSSAEDRLFPTSYIFTAGTTRPTTDAAQLPTPEHPGPTFGSIDEFTIDFETASLNEFDAFVDSSDFVNTADGLLVLGDGGRLVANFSPTVSTDESLTLVLGEVGGQPGEGLDASLLASPSPVPLPGALILLASAVVGLGGISYKRHRPANSYCRIHLGRDPNPTAHNHAPQSTFLHACAPRVRVP